MTRTTKIKIIQITHDLNIGGLQRLVVDISKNLDKSKYEVAVCTLRESGPLEKELIDNGIRVIKMPQAPNGTDYLSFWKLYKMFKREKPDIIHTHNTQPFLEGGFAARLARVPAFVHTEHGRQFPDKKRYMLAERVISHFADVIVAVSESAKNDLIIHQKIDPEKIQVVINGIDGRKYRKKIGKDRKLQELGIDAECRFVLGFAGRLSPEKGLIHLIRAMDQLVLKYPDVLLLIAGEGILFDELTEETKKRKIQNNIRFLGPRTDINEILAVLDVFVLPSLREGLPLVLLEASAAGLPIIATDVGGNAAVVNNGLNGYLVPAGDDSAIYAALINFLQDREKKRKFGEASQKIFKENFAIEKMMRQYSSIYHNCHISNATLSS